MLDFADMTFGGDDIEGDGAKRFADTFKFLVAVDIANCKTPCVFQFYDKAELAKYCALVAIRHVMRSTISDIAGDGMKKIIPWSRKICADGDVPMVVVNRWRDHLGNKRGRPRCSVGTSGFPFENSDVGTIDE